MKCIKLLVALIFILTTQFVFAQSTEEEKYEQGISSKISDGVSILEKRRDKGELKGSPYMNDSYLPASINGVSFNVRYNAHKDEMEYESNGVAYVYLGVLNDTEVFFEGINKKYVYANYKDDKKYFLGYLVEVKKGNHYSLYKRERKSFTPGVAPKTSYDRQIPDEYKLVKDEFYFQVEDGEIVKIPDNKKKFAKLFGDKEKEVLNYMDEKNISLKEEKSLSAFFQYLNSSN